MNILKSCRNCGNELTKIGGSNYWRCNTCGNYFEDDADNKLHKIVGMSLDRLLTEREIEDIEKARLNLVNAGKQKYVSFQSIESACDRLAELVSVNDEQVHIYKVMCGNDAPEINECLNSLKVSENRKYLYDDILFVIKTIKTSRNFQALENLINRFGEIDCENCKELQKKFEEKKTEIAEQVRDVSVERDVFVSYASEDLKQVYSIVNLLEDPDNGGLDCFVADRNLPEDKDNFWTNTYKAMENCHTFLLVSTKNSRNNGNVSHELYHWLECIEENKRECRAEYLLDGYDKKHMTRGDKTTYSRFSGYGFSWFEIGEEELLFNKLCDYVEKIKHDRTVSYMPKREPDAFGEKPVINKQSVDDYPTLENYNKEEFEIDGMVLEEYLGESAVVKIPFGVTSIGDSAFEGCGELKSIVIPNSVTSIGNFAFEGCENLQSVSLPDTLTQFGEWVFKECNSLIYNDYDTAQYLGNNSNPYLVLVKQKDDEVEACTIHNDTKIIAPRAFVADSTLVAEMARRLFSGVTDVLGKRTDYTDSCCGALKEIVIPRGVITIGAGAFYCCGELKEVDIPDSVKLIGAAAFYGCWELKNLKIPYGIEVIENDTFYGCCDLEEMNIPGSVKEIGEQAFRGCGSLKKIEIPESVVSIGAQAFKDCSGISRINIHKNLISIGIGAFSGCEEIESISVDSRNVIYHSKNNCLIETKTKTLVFGCKTGKIPDDGSVIKIGVAAFSFCSGLSSLTLPICIRKIEINAFCGCEDLKMINYQGTYNQWKKVAKGKYLDCVWSDGEDGVSALLLFCSDSNNLKVLDNVKTIDGKISFVLNFIGPDFVILNRGIEKICSNAFQGLKKPVKIRYAGTTEEWNKIEKESGWLNGLKNTVIECTDGDAAD